MENRQNNERRGFDKLLQKFAGIQPPNKEGLVVNYSLSYTRVSSKKQEEGFSLDTQRTNCEQHRKNNQYIDLGLFGNIGESGSKREREEYEKTLDFAIKCPHKPLVILVYELDRFSREGIFAAIQRRELKEKGVYIQDVSDPQKLGDEEAEDKMDATFLEVQRENKRRTKKCNRGKVAKLISGGYLYMVGVGYKRIYPEGEKKSIVVIDEKTIQYARKIFEMVDNHITYDEVVKQLGLMGYKTTACHISKLVRKPFYCGWITTPMLRREYAVGNVDSPYYKGTHPPIISEEMFARINGYVQKNRHGYKLKIENENLPLKKFCKCSECDTPLTGYHNPKGKGRNYYKCRKGCKVNTDGTSRAVSINVEKLHTLFKEELQKYTINPIHFEAIKKQLAMTYQQLTEQDASSIKLWKTELTNEKAKLDILQENLGQGKVPVEVYSKLSSKYNHKIAEIEDQLRQADGNNSNLEKEIEKALEASCNLLKMWELLDFPGKQRLQYLLFPGGIKYSKKNNAVLTDAVNPIFHRIALLSSDLSDQVNRQVVESKESCGVLYNPIRSSNSFSTGLGEIIGIYEEFKFTRMTCSNPPTYYQTDTYTGGAESYKYITDPTQTDSEHSTTQNIIPYSLPFSSGSTTISRSL